MHGFNLVLGSILAHPWAQQLLVQAQRVVTYFRASHLPLQLLRTAATNFNISRGLHSSNTTRFTSKHECTSSVATLQPAFQFVLNNEADAIKNKDVVDILGDPCFWADLPKLNKLQEPLTKVITLVQSNRTTLADVCRCVTCLLVKARCSRPVLFLRHIYLQVSLLVLVQVLAVPVEGAWGCAGCSA